MTCHNQLTCNMKRLNPLGVEIIPGTVCGSVGVVVEPSFLDATNPVPANKDMAWERVYCY